MCQEKHKIVSEVTMDDVKSFNETISKQLVYIQILVQGNMTSQEAIHIFETTAKTFNNADCKSNLQIPEIVINEIPNEGINAVCIGGFNPKDNNTIIWNHYQYGPGSLRTKLLLEVGCQIMDEPTFNTLRTKEQLGYHVYSCLTVTSGILGVSVFVNTQVGHIIILF